MGRNAHVVDIVPQLDGSPPYGLETLRTFADNNPAMFPTFLAARWYTRKHRERLVAEGALFKWRGTICVDPDRLRELAKQLMREAVTK